MSSQNAQPRYSQFLIALTIPPAQTVLPEKILAAAMSFFDIAGGAERTDVGVFQRTGRGDTVEHLNLVSFVVEERGTGGNPLALAKRLDAILKSIIEAYEAEGVVARVFVARGEGLS